MPLRVPATSTPPPPQLGNPQSPADLPADGLALFRTIFLLVRTTFASLVKHYASDPEHDCLQTVCLVFECLIAVMALEYTLHAAPERITPRQLLRLSKAARALTHLTGQSFDFSPWTSLSPSELDAISPKPTPNPLTPYYIPTLEIRPPSSGQGPITLLMHPGATLANVIKKLVRILPPDFLSVGTVPPWTVPVLSPSPSQSELQSQSQSCSQSQSIPSIVSISSAMPPHPEGTVPLSSSVSINPQSSIAMMHADSHAPP